MFVEGVKIQNFKVLQNVALGRVQDGSFLAKVEPLTPLTALMGKPNSGKSTFLDAFAFLGDCLEFGVEAACDRRGGFERVRSRGQTGPIKFVISARSEDASNEGVLFHYELEIDDAHSKTGPYVSLEQLHEISRKLRMPVFTNRRGILNFKDELDKTKVLEMNNCVELGLSVVGAFSEQIEAVQFRQFVESWQFHDFDPDKARALSPSGIHTLLSPQGGNLAKVVQYFQECQSGEWLEIVEKMRQRVPGLEAIDLEVAPDRLLLMKFKESAFEQPFFTQDVGNGTLKMLAHLLLTANPFRSRLLCIEGFDREVSGVNFRAMAFDAREYASMGMQHTNVFVSTNQLSIYGSFDLDEVWILEKGSDGFSTVKRM